MHEQEQTVTTTSASSYLQLFRALGPQLPCLYNWAIGMCGYS